MSETPWVVRSRPTAINTVLQELRALQAEGKPVLSLMRGQPDSPTPAHIVEAAIRALHDGRTGYPDNRGEPELRRAVAEKLERDQGLVYDPDREILITDGATCGIALALAASLQPGDAVLLPDPIYDAYLGPIALWGGEIIRVPANICAGRFSIAAGGLEASFQPRAKLVLLNNPWNPVGTVFAQAELRAILDSACIGSLSVISDEIYEGLVYDGRQHISPASVSDSARQRTVLVNSLSKTYSMTGWRVGYCAGPASVIQGMTRVLQQFSRGPATFVQDAAACALRSSQECVRRLTREYQERRDRMVRCLSGIPGVQPLVPEGGLFVMVDVRRLGMPSDAVRRFLLQEMGVAVVHGSAYGPAGEGTLRVSFAGGGELLEHGLQRLREGLLRVAEGASE
ncbi:MAG TPA: aminotransferase class I/II-fold pyridoxal phosphate-dependent enzyme [Gemmataceae bacterium]|nr:aminotransferase class I/II-fold pyridoxal phosphate-dependent enzyme [Gemmataceae bacterium]